MRFGRLLRNPIEMEEEKGYENLDEGLTPLWWRIPDEALAPTVAKGACLNESSYGTVILPQAVSLREIWSRPLDARNRSVSLPTLAHDDAAPSRTRTNHELHNLYCT